MWSLRRALLAALLAVVALTGATACGSDDAAAPPGVALPDDFPSDQVPLVGGTVQSAERTDTGSWSVTVQAPANDGNGYDNAVKKLTDAGYRESSTINTGRERGVMMQRETDEGTYWVTVGISAAAQGGQSTVLYTVTRA
ncbi:MAG: hypothetical protein QM809_06060 [Gordonia sp. (in: high G+C Gram-positive bacteria)]|uniref:hypothetical protein n=1 Tax=Gordonia sp. (in: high G+C Gram-positive bacteria) TaxID=84139 RepID=UPI0039E30D4B